MRNFRMMAASTFVVRHEYDLSSVKGEETLLSCDPIDPNVINKIPTFSVTLLRTKFTVT